MDKIGIELFTADIPEYNKPLDVQTIINGNSLRNRTELTESINLILKKNQLRRKQLISVYTELFEKCLEKIHKAIEHSKSEIVFIVPTIVFRCDLYNTEECIDFIKKKLKTMKIDYYQINDTTLFISWHYLELYLSKH
jgi:hypothetical protein